MTIHLTPVEWIALFVHYCALSLLGVGGAITTAPDMHRYLVEEHQWLTDTQFSASIALAQAAPGPNVLFIALLGWNVGVNAAGGMSAGALAWGLGLLGLGATMAGILLPSSLLAWMATRWSHRNRERLGVRAFKLGMAPVVVGLLVSTAWLLNSAYSLPAHWPLWLLSAVVAIIVWRTRMHLLWLLAAGALLGAFGWV